MEKILVTGGCGMIGSNLVKRLVSEGHSVRVVDNLWRGKLEHLNDKNGFPVIDLNKDFINVDLRIPGMLEPYLKDIDVVYHLADIVAGIGYVFKNQGLIFRDNILINSNTISSVRNSKVKRFVYVGTACSFPKEKQYGIDAPPLVEADQYPASPESAYGWSKLMGEYEAFLMESETDIQVSVLSLHNVYGTPCDLSETTSQVIPALITRALNYPKVPFLVWGSGSQGRAFVHVFDVVTALVEAKSKGLGKGLIQIGPSECTSIKAIAESIVDISHKDIEIKYDLTKPEGDRGRCCDYTKAKDILGWSPTITINDGLRDLYEWAKGGAGYD